MATIDVETTETAEEARANEVLILDMLDRFLRTEVKPHVHALEAADEYPHEIVEKMKDMGLFGCLISQEYGDWVCRHRRTQKLSTGFRQCACR